MNANIKYLGLGVCVAVVLLGTLVNVVSATTWYVEEGESIQAAVDNASAGDTIIVRDGTYTENINVNKPHLTIRSENGADSTIVSVASSYDDVFEISADYVNINGFTVGGKVGGTGIDIHDANYCEISNNSIHSFGVGIRLHNSSNNLIVNNNCSKNGNQGGGCGIHLGYSSCNNILNNNISNNRDGIKLGHSPNNYIVDNSIYTYFNNIYSEDGISLDDSPNTVIVNNCINSDIDNRGIGIHIWTSSNINISDNRFINAGIYLGISGASEKLSYYNTHIIENNTINGRPIYYYKNKSNIRAPEDAGSVILANCTGIIVENINSSFGTVGIELAYTKNSTISNNEALSNTWYGIYLYQSSNNNISSNEISNNIAGIYPYKASNNNITDNNISNSYVGLRLSYSGFNDIVKNKVTNSFYGTYLSDESDNNVFCCNNFENNTNNVHSEDSTNTWNSTKEITYTYNGSEFENYLGNYWDDYADTDVNGDGIWDNPYTINGDNDWYPLKEPWENYIEVSESPWPMFQHDAQHTGRSPFVGPGTESPEVQVLIEGESDNDVFGSPIVGSDGTLYLGWIHLASKWGLCAFYPDGTQKWFYEIQPSGGGTPLLNPPALLESAKTVYTYSSGAGVFAINIDNGSLRWNKSYHSYTNLVIGDDGILYFIALSYSPNESYWYLIGLDESGKEVLSYKIGASAPVGSDAVSSPTIDKEGTVYFGYNDTLFAINPDGTEKWRRTFVGEYDDRPPRTPWVTTPSVADDGIIYVVVKQESDHGGQYPNYDDHLHAIDPKNPEQDKWVKGSQWLLGPPSISTEGNIHLFNRIEGAWWWSGYLLGFDSQGNCLENWPIEKLGSEASLLVIDKEENIYGWFGDTNSIKAFNPNGEELWSVRVGDMYGQFLSLDSDKTLYVCGHKKLYAVSPSISLNNPPNPPINLAQFKSDSETVIPVGGTTDERTVVFKGTVSDPDGDMVKLQVELRRLDEYGGQFDETKGGLKDSVSVENGSEAVACAYGLIDADYHWRARAVDEHGEPSEWVDFGDNDISEADFTVIGAIPSGTIKVCLNGNVDDATKDWKYPTKYNAPVFRRGVDNPILILEFDSQLPQNYEGLFEVYSPRNDERIDKAIEWAENQLGSHEYDEYCWKFVVHAYKKAGADWILPPQLSAKEAANSLKPLKTGIPPRGTLVFYDCWGTLEGEYRNWGHVGLSIGNGDVIHAFGKVRVDNYLDIQDLSPGTGWTKSEYIGWVEPPVNPPIGCIGSLSSSFCGIDSNSLAGIWKWSDTKGNPLNKDQIPIGTYTIKGYLVNRDNRGDKKFIGSDKFYVIFDFDKKDEGAFTTRAKTISYKWPPALPGSWTEGLHLYDRQIWMSAINWTNGNITIQEAVDSIANLTRTINGKSTYHHLHVDETKDFVNNGYDDNFNAQPDPDPTEKWNHNYEESTFGSKIFIKDLSTYEYYIFLRPVYLHEKNGEYWASKWRTDLVRGSNYHDVKDFVKSDLRPYKAPQGKDPLEPQLVSWHPHPVGNCEDYAMLSTAYLRCIGIPAKIVAGWPSLGEAHMWTWYYNKCKWYHLDTDFELAKDVWQKERYERCVYLKEPDCFVEHVYTEKYENGQIKKEDITDKYKPNLQVRILSYNPNAGNNRGELKIEVMYPSTYDEELKLTSDYSVVFKVTIFRCLKAPIDAIGIISPLEIYPGETKTTTFTVITSSTPIYQSDTIIATAHVGYSGFSIGTSPLTPASLIWQESYSASLETMENTYTTQNESTHETINCSIVNMDEFSSGRTGQVIVSINNTEDQNATIGIAIGMQTAEPVIGVTPTPILVGNESSIETTAHSIKEVPIDVSIPNYFSSGMYELILAPYNDTGILYMKNYTINLTANYDINVLKPERVTMGTPFNLTVSIENNDTEPICNMTTKLTLHYYFNTTESLAKYISQLNPGEMHTFTWNLTPIDWGKLGLDVEVYSDGGYEMRFVNINSLQTPKLWVTPQVPEKVRKGADFTLNATVFNSGDIPTDNITLNITTPENVTANRTCVELGIIGSRQNKTCSFRIFQNESKGFMILLNATALNETAINYAFIEIEQPPITFFDTDSPANPYPSIMGNHTGTIKPNHTVIATKLYTYPCPGTGGHTEYAKIWNLTWNATATWKGYVDDWHNISFDKTVVLLPNKTYDYTIRTGSYPQIIHESPFNATGGTITCDKFIDANGRIYYDWIPAIKFF